MKVWFPLSATGTGSEVFTAQLAGALARRGVESVVTHFPATIESMPWLLALRRPPPRVDVVHANAASAAGFMHHAIPLVMTAHGAFERAAYDAFKSMPQRLYHALLVRPALHAAVARAAATSAVSSWVADIYRREYAAPDVQVIHNWVDAAVFHPVRKDAGRKLLFVGRKAWQKGGHLLAALVQRLPDGFELACTWNRGDWDGPVPANVTLLGPVPRERMPALYQACDALVVPSIAEGFCLAAAEAMACGLPVFGFRGHGLDEVLGPLAPDCSVDLLDLDGLVGAIARVFDDQRLYRDLSARARAHVQAHFTEDVAVDRYLALYRATRDAPGR